jgi:hypothetical protein
VVSSTEINLGTRLQSVTELLLLERPPLPEPAVFSKFPTCASSLRRYRRKSGRPVYSSNARDKLRQIVVLSDTQ